MAWGRKKTNGRREPLFGLAASLSELRLGPQDRVTISDDKPKAKTSKPKVGDPDKDPQRERNTRDARGNSKRKFKTRALAGISRLFYWGAVLGLWAGIAVVFAVDWAGAHLPAI